MHLQRFTSIGIWIAIILGGVTMAHARTISKEQAIAIAAKSADGFLGTYVSAELSHDYWLVSAFSKSAKPPVLLVVNAAGKIIYQSANSNLPIHMTGIAANLPGHAALLTEKGLTIYVGKEKRWPQDLEKKQVVVKGKLVSRTFSRDEDAGRDSTAEDTVYQELVFEEPTWLLR